MGNSENIMKRISNLDIEQRLQEADTALDAARKAKDRKATWICLGRVAELKDMLALASESQRKAGESDDETPERQEENTLLDHP